MLHRYVTSGKKKREGEIHFYQRKFFVYNVIQTKNWRESSSLQGGLLPGGNSCL